MDGTIAPTAEAVIPLADDGLYRGDGVFEVIRLYAGRPFALTDHLDRLERSAAAIELPVDRRRLESELEPLLEANGDEDAQLRVIVTRAGRRLLMIEPVPPRGESVTLATVSYQPTVILNGVKSLSYAANMQATRIANARGADEALFVTPDGIVLEPPTASVFWADADGRLKTPSLEHPILDSITRDRLVGAIPVEQGAFDVSELATASEAFLASTTREVQPVAAIDGRAIAWPGPRTEEARAALAAAITTELGDPASRAS